jgi:hypothetical protein
VNLNCFELTFVTSLPKIIKIFVMVMVYTLRRTFFVATHNFS